MEGQRPPRTQPEEFLSPVEQELFVALNPDQIALEGLDRICLVDPDHPELGFRLRSDDELPSQ